MKRVVFLVIGFFFLVACSKHKDAVAPPPEENPIKTKLDDKTTLYGLVSDENNQPVEGVVVSDGFTAAKTDDNGIYQLVRNKKAKFVFYSTPSDCKVMVDANNCPKFYEKLTSKDRLIRQDFSLVKQAVENEFTLFAVADPQCRNVNELARYKNETLKDIEEVVKKYKNAYAFTLGDIVFDTPELWGDMKSAMSNKSLPFFQTIGNHDHLQTAPNDEKSVENYQDTFGPTDYSFNRGKTHVVVMDNVIYTAKQVYTGGITDEQWEWLKEDLAQVPKDNMVIYAAHIPFRSGGQYDHIGYHDEILNLLSTFSQAHIMTGHTHYQANYLHQVNGKLIYEHIHGAACGAWWNSTICSDGTPNGYAIYQVNGNNIVNWKYKATGYDENYQIRAYDASQMYGPANKYTYIFGATVNLNLAGNGWVVANVWNADPDWKIELFQNGTKVGDMQKRTTRDFWATYYHLEELGKAKGSDFDKSLDHFYIGQIQGPVTGADIEVRATDRFGNVYKTNELKVDYSKIGGY
ncbi:serine/threonine protein phosphatase [Pedobacter sp. BS3]|uniref:calcineurin-like phosphoesterase C-terminal domain-containing protein n=1 Tax=Pedobacter sp. BS3 TaxID=2567937 RepID=UPI0011EBC9B7|nr:calcineurin-like phosphoesterase family protein [Pedobacter sp. BS3]TZF83790.1 serine/threonine protein phosphatase [Pedobacter sp. BS3]